MVKTYDELLDNNGLIIGDRTRLFIRNKDIEEDGTIKQFFSGSSFIVDEPGTQFIVDHYVINQIEKLQVVDGFLTVKDGVQIQERIMSPEEIRFAEIEKEMTLLKRKKIETTGPTGPTK